VIQAVFFDLYETLVTHFDPDWRPPPESIAQRLGIDEQHFAEHWPRFDADWQAGIIGSYEEALTRLCQAAGQDPDASVLSALTREYRAAYARPFATIEAEIVEMLSVLKKAGLRLGIITNASGLDAEPWPACLLAPLFDDVVVSHQVGLLKPDRRIYALACRRLEVRPSEAIYAGDGGSNELAGATQAGLAAYWCSWFLERWPVGTRPNGFPGDSWRHGLPGSEPPFPRLARPAELLKLITAGS
jgi:HAD superfamily hydrolase (TIGR01549 family)